jgi:peptidoglycan hydrolase-like protein with peptidoglycan-binding domain
MPQRTRRTTRPASPVQRDVRRAIAVLALGAVLIGVISLGESIFKSKPSQATAAGPNSAAATSPSPTAVPAADAPITTGDTAGSSPVATDPAQPGQQDLVGDEPSPTDAGCKIDKRELRVGDSGTAVTCMQQALIDIGYLNGSASGTFDNATFSAVNKLQKDKDMFVDGVVGRETAISLDIWPDEASLVIHTPPPAPGAVDLLGYPLSYVATSGPDAPPLPANSGSGKRVVYDRAGQRVWAVDKNNRVIRSWLVSGSKYNNEVPGTHEVYSRSEVSTAWNGKALLPHMIRYTKTKIGNIGFHGIPRHVSDGSKYEKDTELGTRLSGGCTRQADLDADFMWDFAQIGTTVVVT